MVNDFRCDVLSFANVWIQNFRLTFPHIVSHLPRQSTLKNDPTFDDFLAEIATYRCELDQEKEIQA